MIRPNFFYHLGIQVVEPLSAGMLPSNAQHESQFSMSFNMCNLGNGPTFVSSAVAISEFPSYGLRFSSDMCFPCAHSPPREPSPLLFPQESPVHRTLEEYFRDTASAVTAANPHLLRNMALLMGPRGAIAHPTDGGGYWIEENRPKATYPSATTVLQAWPLVAQAVYYIDAVKCLEAAKRLADLGLQICLASELPPTKRGWRPVASSDLECHTWTEPKMKAWRDRMDHTMCLVMYRH